MTKVVDGTALVLYVLPKTPKSPLSEPASDMITDVERDREITYYERPTSTQPHSNGLLVAPVYHNQYSLRKQCPSETGSNHQCKGENISKQHEL
eukprot:6488991-Amphidinium_carterae.1